MKTSLPIGKTKVFATPARSMTELVFTKPLLVPGSSPHQSPFMALPPLSRLPTSSLLRSLLMNTVIASPLLRKPAMAIMAQSVSPKSIFFNPERNVILRTILHRTAYEHFCAGRNVAEVKQTISSVKGMGFTGVILCYGREVVLSKGKKGAVAAEPYEAIDYEAIEQWKEGLLATLSCIGPGDFLAVKFTGAGRIALDALQSGKEMPHSIREVMEMVCSKTAEQNSRLWLDAEQTRLQPTVDEWTIELMRKFNRNGNALVSNTIQAYLKSAPANVERHLKLATEEGWACGLKLVRGAYIESDNRKLIHNTIEDTHRCFDSLAELLINQEMPATLAHLPFPKTSLFLATHNLASVQKAQALQQSRLENSQPTITLEFGQLQGMADEVSCELLQEADIIKATAKLPLELEAAPKAFKYLTWGTLNECLGYLYRRAIENQGAVERTAEMAHALRQEVWRRITTALRITGR